MKTIFLLLPTGITVRNFLATDVINNLINNSTYRIVCYVHDHEKYQSYFVHERVIYKKFIRRKKYTISNFFHLILRRRFYEIKATKTNLILKNAPIFRNFKGLLLSFLKYPFPKSKRIFLVFNYLANLTSNVTDEIKADFDLYKPSLVISTHIVSLDEYNYISWAQKIKIKTIGMVKSFDNLTSKGYMPFKYNSVVVWNKIMAEEIKELYDYTDDQIFITGVPQFDIYKNAPLILRDDFFKNLKLDTNKKTVLFATNSSYISPDDEINIENIAKYLQSIDAQMIVRIHQMDDIKRYEHIKLNNVSFQLPGSEAGIRSHDRVATKNFILDLRDTIFFSDVTINTASTMSLDASAIDKPIINISYDCNPKQYNKSVKRFYDFDHYQFIIKSQGTSISTSSNELFDSIQQYFTNPNLHQEGRKIIRTEMLNNNVGTACFDLAKVIINEAN